MGIITWLIVGFIAGAIAKAITPQKEKGGWVSTIIIGIIGSMVGGFLAQFGLAFFLGKSIISSIIIASGGAVLVLWIYHRYLAEKWNLPI